MTPATFCWGQECIDFLTLYKASCAFSDHLFKAAQHFGIRGFYGRALYQSFVEGRQEDPFRKKDFAFQLYWLNKGIPHQCLDPRDRVFALLGHYSARIGTDRRLIMKADYSLTKADVYQEIAIRALTYAKFTFLLHAVHHIGKCPTLSLVALLPSSNTNQTRFLFPHGFQTGIQNLVLGHFGARSLTGVVWLPTCPW